MKWISLGLLMFIGGFVGLFTIKTLTMTLFTGIMFLSIVPVAFGLGNFLLNNKETIKSLKQNYCFK